MIELLRVGVATAPMPDDACLEVLLQVADSATTYRSRYLDRDPHAIRARTAARRRGQSAVGRLSGGDAAGTNRRACRRHGEDGTLASTRSHRACSACCGTPVWTSSSAATARVSVWRLKLTSRRSAMASTDLADALTATLPEPLGAVAADADDLGAMLYRARHTTPYRYEAPVSQCLSEVRLTPRSLPWQTVLDRKIEATPPPRRSTSARTTSATRSPALHPRAARSASPRRQRASSRSIRARHR